MRRLVQAPAVLCVECGSDSPEAFRLIGKKQASQLAEKRTISVKALEQRLLIDHSGYPRSQQFRNHLLQFVRTDGLCHIAVHAGLETPLAVALHRVSGHGYDGNVRTGPLLKAADGCSR